MIAADQSAADRTLISADQTRGLGDWEFVHPPATFSLTPASLISLTAIADRHDLLHGVGLDWGSGVGCLAIAAARVPAVELVIGLELNSSNVAVARTNAEHNGVAEQTRFMTSNAYRPSEPLDREFLQSHLGRVDFILANPPASEGDDGFNFRRIVLREGRPWLRAGGIVFLNVSLQYGRERLLGLTETAPGFRYDGVLATTDWVPFDLTRPDLWRNIQDYVAEEQRGGWRYAFQHPDSAHEESMDAHAALQHFQRTGMSPHSKWQTHLFRYEP